MHAFECPKLVIVSSLVKFRIVKFALMSKLRMKKSVIRFAVFLMLGMFAVSCASSGGYYRKAPSGKFKCK